MDRGRNKRSDTRFYSTSIAWSIGSHISLNSIFNGTWSDQFQFDPDDTVDGYFTLRDGTEKKGRFMSDTRFVQVIDESSN